MAVQHRILMAQSRASDPREAAREFHAAVSQPETALVVFFCSSEYDLDPLAEELDRLFGGIPLVGCTTAGEIGPAGYCNHSLVGASFPAGSFTTVTGCFNDLQQFEMVRGQAFVQSLLERLEIQVPSISDQSSFAFLLIDGLSAREEQVASVFQYALGKVPMFGGSAGDGLKFCKTHVYHGGRFHSDSAVLILAATSLPFRIFKTQHFILGDERLVVTEADTTRRIVKEINGLPAAQEYARLAGVDVRDLDPIRFAVSPVVVLIDGAEYVRSIQKANPDGSLTFYCAIEEGVVLRIAYGTDLVENLDRAFEKIRAEIGRPQIILGCDCILRGLEISKRDLKDRVEEIFRRNNTIGFGTYGEQFRGVHINQTLTGIAFGAPGEPDHG